MAEIRTAAAISLRISRQISALRNCRRTNNPRRPRMVMLSIDHPPAPALLELVPDRSRQGRHLPELVADGSRDGVGRVVPQVVAEPDRVHAGHEGSELVRAPVVLLPRLEDVAELRRPLIPEPIRERGLEAD